VSQKWEAMHWVVASWLLPTRGELEELEELKEKSEHNICWDRIYHMIFHPSHLSYVIIPIYGQIWDRWRII
jgi:hypothetical protein